MGSQRVGHDLANENKQQNLVNELIYPNHRSQRRQWHPTPVLLLENPMAGGAWWAAVHGVTRSQTRQSNFTFTFHFHALEEEMATHSSILDWRIPGMGEPGGLPSKGSHRVRHDWSDLAAAAAATIDQQRIGNKYNRSPN